MELNDELLCAYIDGELEPQQRADLELALAQDAGGRLRLARMRAADARLRVEIPVRAIEAGDPLARLILQDESAPAPQPRINTGRNTWRNAFVLAAACATLALGFVLARMKDGDAGTMAVGFAAGSLQAALEQAHSGAPLGDETGAASIVLTVSARDGKYCRLYRVRAGAGITEGVACREARGWRVVAFDATVASDALFHTAGASPLIDGVLDNLGGATLGEAAEHALLERGWRRK